MGNPREMWPAGGRRRNPWWTWSQQGQATSPRPHQRLVGSLRCYVGSSVLPGVEVRIQLQMGRIPNSESYIAGIAVVRVYQLQNDQLRLCRPNVSNEESVPVPSGYSDSEPRILRTVRETNGPPAVFFRLQHHTTWQLANGRFCPDHLSINYYQVLAKTVRVGVLCWTDPAQVAVAGDKHELTAIQLNWAHTVSCLPRLLSMTFPSWVSFVILVS